MFGKGLVVQEAWALRHFPQPNSVLLLGGWLMPAGGIGLAAYPGKDVAAAESAFVVVLPVPVVSARANVLTWCAPPLHLG
jgi:hypothetical protein